MLKSWLTFPVEEQLLEYMVWAHFISEFSPGWVIGRPGRPRKGQVQQTWGEVQAVQIPPSWFHLLSLSFLSHNFGMMLFLGLSREIKEMPCQNHLVFSKASVHAPLLLFHFKVCPWISSFTHVSQEDNSHASNLLPEEPGRLWRGVSSFSQSHNMHFPPIWVTLESERRYC